MPKKSPAGHRRRLKKIYAETPPEEMKKENLIELLLFYAQKRRDTSQLASELLALAGGDIGALLSFDKNSVAGAEGSGESVWELLALFNEIAKCGYLENEAADDNGAATLPSNLLAAKELAQSFGELGKETSLEFLAFNGKGQLTVSDTVAKGFKDLSGINAADIVSSALRSGASTLIILRNNASGSYNPQDGDIEFIEKLKSLLKSVSIGLNDYIITSNGGSMSLTNDVRYCGLFEDE